jgi:hypothetical protein
MATDSSVLKKLKQIPRKTTTATDMEDLNDLAIHYGEELAYAIASKEDCVIGGFAVSFGSGADVSISAGAALKQGQLVKNTAAVTKTIAANAAGSDRIDLVSISGVTETDSDNLLEPVLGAISLNDFGKPTPTSIGTGDDTTTLFELPLTSDERALNDTLLIYLDGVLSGGWSFAPAQGSSGEDSIVFHDAPASGVAITAAGDFVTGGEEALPSSPGLPSRSALTAEITVTQGVAGGSAPALPSNHVWLCEITVPAGWSTGNTLTFDNEVEKVFLAAKDADNDSTAYSPFDRPSRISDSIRNMAQVRQGCRLYYHSSTAIRMSPGWINSLGLSCRTTSPVSLTLQSTSSGSAGYVPSTGWYPVFAVPQSASNGSGLAPALRIGAGVNSLGHDTTSPAPLWQGGLHLGWVYVTVSGSTVTIKPFHSRGKQGDVVYWETPADIALAGSVDSTASPDIDVTVWCPPTGCEILAEVDALFVPADAADLCIVEAGSFKYNSGSPNPWPRIKLAQGGTTGTTRLVGNGWLLVEDDSGTRYVHNLRTTSGTGSCTGNLRVMGYRDSSYATMDSSGGILSY